jgi:acetoin utilization protein AcuB
VLVSHVMTKDPVTIQAGDTLAQAMERMTAGKFRRLLVVENGKLAGIITERDLRQHTGHLDRTRVSAAMSADPVTVTPSTMLETAAYLLVKHKIGGLPVVEGDKIAGIITSSDMLSAFVKMLNASQEGVSRIDLAVSDPGEIATIAELTAGEAGQVLGMGTYRAEWAESDIFYVRVPSAEARRVANTLEQNGFNVLAIHS